MTDKPVSDSLISESAGTADTQTEDAPQETGSIKAARNLPLPSSNPATNLLIADIIVRSASSLFRKNVQQRVAKAASGDQTPAQEPLDGRGIITSLGLYGASKLANRSVPGLAIVTGGLIAKALYDRGKAIQLRKRGDKTASAENGPRED